MEAARQPIAGAPSGSTLLTAVAVLALVSLWAFSGDTSGATSQPGIRANPDDVYNPVASGEALPDGFRQLLPRDAIRPIYDPQFVPGSLSAWPASTDVIGVAIGDESKAYPVSFLNGRELVVDEIDDIPILVSW